MAAVNIPVPLPGLSPFLGCSFSIPVTVAILGFMAAALLVAFVVVLLSVQVPGTVPGLPVSVLAAAVGLVSVVVVTVCGTVVRVFVVFLGLHVGRVSALLGLRVKCLLPGEAPPRPAAMVVVLSGGRGAVLGLLDWLWAGLLFCVGSRTGGAVSPLTTLRTLVAKGESTGIRQPRAEHKPGHASVAPHKHPKC